MVKGELQMLNNIVIQGRFVRDPELKTTPNGAKVTSFALAVERDYKVNGKKPVDFIDVVAWRSTAEYIAKYFTKGTMALVKGHLETRSWKDKDGKNHKVTEIVVDNIYFGEAKKKSSTSESTEAPEPTEVPETPEASMVEAPPEAVDPMDADEEDLPF